MYPSHILSFFLVILALASCFISFDLAKKSRQWVAALAVLQTFIGPMFLGLSAMIMFFQGWRLDPILLFMVFLLHVYCGISIVKDWAISKSQK